MSASTAGRSRRLGRVRREGRLPQQSHDVGEISICVRFLGSDVAVLDATFTLTHLDGRLFEMGPAGHSKAELVATKEQGRWSIAVFRNMIPFVRPLAGPLERSIANADRV
jgi:hypothetical protein